MSRFVTLLEEDCDLAIRVRRSGPKTLNDAVQEAILSKRQSCPRGNPVQEVILSKRQSCPRGNPVQEAILSKRQSCPRGNPAGVADLAKSIQALAEGSRTENLTGIELCHCEELTE
ncbi:hypothetical protein EMCRGX_G015358 [Ephydatia muelleri]